MNQIILANSDEHYAAAEKLFRAYVAWLDMDLSYQNFDQELTRIPEIYGPPTGGLALAQHGPRFVGCCAVRALEADICELKRLWVEPDATGDGLGRRLCARIVDLARELGYARMRLDTQPARMAPAGRIYAALGFREIPKYYDNPNDGIAYLELDLQVGPA